MRLTLRTLLAWLDDTLPTAEVRQIGKQVAESPFAQELVDRTYRVTRQRRLLVPTTMGPDATDPNSVAAYLDNELPPEEVAEYEKKCLTSDVNLAEVASVHQILSLIGQKAKVPPDAKKRMYRLVKGRESAYAREAVRRPVTPAVPEPLTSPPTPWAAPMVARRPLAERLGISALVLGLIGLILWTAYTTFAPDNDRAQVRIAQNEAPPQPAPTEPKDVAPPPPTTTAPEPTRVATGPAETTATDAAAPKPDEGKAVAATPAKLTSENSLVVAWNPEKRDWARLAPATPIKDDTRLLNLQPYWSAFQADSAKFYLIDETEVRYLGRDRRAALKLGFDRGKVVLSGGPDGVPYQVQFAGKTLSIQNAPGGLVGLQRTWTHTPGVAGAESSPVVIYASGGEVVLESGDSKKTLKGPAIATWSESGTIQPSSKSAMPAWISEAGPPPSAKELGDRFLKDFSTNGSLLRDLVQAVDGDDPDLRRLAIQALGAVGDAEMIVPVLNNAMTDASTRRAAADILRSMLARGGEPAKAVRDELGKVFGSDLAGPTEKMLVGFTPQEGAQEATQADLVRSLSAPELGTRELALESLMSLTGRDNLEYDAAKPEGRGLKAWQDLLHKKELMKGNGTPLPPRPEDTKRRSNPPAEPAPRGSF
jgi:hypothetical protein